MSTDLVSQCSNMEHVALHEVLESFTDTPQLRKWSKDQAARTSGENDQIFYRLEASCVGLEPTASRFLV